MFSRFLPILLLSSFRTASGITSTTNKIIYADDSYTAHSDGNKTVVMEWTLNDSGTQHVIRCIADTAGDTSPSLEWLQLGDGSLENLSIPNAVVDTSNAKDISITFIHVVYNHTGDYYCRATDFIPSSNASETIFRIRVVEYKSKGVVALWTILIILFSGGTFLICRKFRLNEFSTRIDF